LKFLAHCWGIGHAVYLGDEVACTDPQGAVRGIPIWHQSFSVKIPNEHAALIGLIDHSRDAQSLPMRAIPHKLHVEGSWPWTHHDAKMLVPAGSDGLLQHVPHFRGGAPPAVGFDNNISAAEAELAIGRP
jgi:hypothetical protein